MGPFFCPLIGSSRMQRSWWSSMNGFMASLVVLSSVKPNCGRKTKFKAFSLNRRPSCPHNFVQLVIFDLEILQIDFENAPLVEAEIAQRDVSPHVILESKSNCTLNRFFSKTNSSVE